jgi:hypothetical protein
MSRAFMKESDGEWLSDIAPTIGALINFLTKENNGIRVVEEKRTLDEKGNDIVHMSNGISYTKGSDGRWMVAGYE